MFSFLHQRSITKSIKMRIAPPIKLIAFLFLLAIGSATVAAQTRELRGRVTDETGAYIVAAAVLLDDGQGHTFTTQTDQQGNYRLNAVPPGSYSLTVTSESFAKSIEQIELKSKNSTIFNVTLKVIINDELEITTDS